MAKSNRRPSRMLEEIMEAIAHLRETNGSTLKHIAGHMDTIASTSKAAKKSVPLIKRALDQGVASGLLLRKSGKYKLALGAKDYKIFKNFKDKSKKMKGPKDAVKKRRGDSSSAKRSRSARKAVTETTREEYSDSEDVPSESGRSASAAPTDGVRVVRSRRRRRRRTRRRRRSKRSRSRRKRRGSRRAGQSHGDESDDTEEAQSDSAKSASDAEGQHSEPEDKGRRRRRRRRRSHSRRRGRGKRRSRSNSEVSDGEEYSPLHSNIQMEMRKSQEKQSNRSRRNSRSSLHRDVENYTHEFGDRHVPNCGDPECICNLGVNNDLSGHSEENPFNQN